MISCQVIISVNLESGAYRFRFPIPLFHLHFSVHLTRETPLMLMQERRG